MCFDDLFGVRSEVNYTPVEDILINLSHAALAISVDSTTTIRGRNACGITQWLAITTARWPTTAA